MGRTLSSDSANVINLPASPVGFTAGDYVYRTSGGYGVVPDAALATGNFNFNAAPTPDYEATATTSNELTYVEQLGGSQGSQVAAQLTNTNIVYAYATGSSVTYTAAATVNFRIETTTGTVVVAETSTTMTVQGPFGVSVIALPAGGFAIVCTPYNGGNYSLSARFYNADGSAATSALNASLSLTGTLATSRLRLQTLTDGSVIIGYNAANVFELRKVTTAGFDATFGTSGVVTNLNSGNAAQWWDFVTDSSNSIHAIASSGSTSLVMRRYNSSGAQQTTSTVSSLTGLVAVTIAITSDGTIRGFVQDSTGIAVITWNGTTAALGTRIITSVGSPGTGVALGAFAQGASGGYVVFYNAFITGSSGAFGLFLRAFDSSNVALASATRVNSAIAVSYRTQLTPIVISGNTRVYFGVFQANSISYALASVAVPMGIAYFAYSNTTYALVGAPTVNYNWLNQGPFALGAYMRSASTGAVARFSIATTGTYATTTNTLGATLIPKTIVDSTSTTPRLALAPLPNGEFVAVWARSTGGETFISKYSVTGVLQAGPVSVGTGGGSTATYSASVATFANGNILVTYHDASTTVLKFRIYTPSLTVVSSGTVDGNYTVSAATPVTCTSFGDGDYIAVVYRDPSSYVVTRCVRSTGAVTALLGTAFSASSTWSQMQVIGFKSNSFAIAAVTSTVSYMMGVRKTGATSFLATSVVNNGSSFFNTIGNAPCLGSPIAAPGTTSYFIGGNSGATAYRLTSFNPLFAASDQLNMVDTSGTFSGLSLNSGFGSTIGYTATGLPVIVANRAATLFITLSAFTMPMNGTDASTSGVTTTLATSASNNAVTAIPHVGDAILIGFIDSGNLPAFVSIVASPFTVNATLTAGTDVSTSTLGLTPEGGYSLQGISITAAASGSNGLVQTRGTAVLNSSYSAATPATFFDFRNPLIFGTNGTVVGRTVIMGNN
jgi:hypothetical protein